MAPLSRKDAQLVSVTATAVLLDTRLAAEIGFINFDGATARAIGRGKVTRTHRFADTVGEKPCGLILDLEYAAKLVGADTLGFVNYIIATHVPYQRYDVNRT